MSDDNSRGLGSRSQMHGNFADEISLVDLWLIFLKRKLLALAVFMAVMLLGASYLLVAKPVYLSRSVVAIGFMPDLSGGDYVQSKVIEEPQLLAKRLIEEYKVNDKDGQSELPAMYSVAQDKKSGDRVIELSAKAHTAEEARNFLSPIALGIVSRHKEFYDQAYAELEKIFESRKNILANVDKEADELQRHVDNLSKNSLDQVSPFYMKLSLLSQQKVDLLRQNDVLKANLEVKYKPTEILREPTLSVKKHKPKVALVVAATFAIGVLLGVFFIFVAEFFENVRKHARRSPG